MNYGVKFSIGQTVVPAAGPVSVTEAKSDMNVTISPDDTLIGTYITAARKYVENVLGRQLITATYRLSLVCFPPEILLPYHGGGEEGHARKSTLVTFRRGWHPARSRSLPPSFHREVST